MKLRLRNTLSGKKEEFVPIDQETIRMYVCGPTVYSRAHLGNARSAVVFDILYRSLKKIYPKVIYVRNITDIDDKIYKAATERGISIGKLTEETIKMYHEDIAAIGVLPIDFEPRATKHIDDIISFIEKLIENGNAYCSSNHVYFSVSSFEKYGQLSKKNADELMTGARIEPSSLKKNPMDFVLWKPSNDDFKIGWDSPWGYGRPGWHIECSAMSLKYLGTRFDIHGGGLDLIFPHHENEIAQSCSLTQQEVMANYWIHNGYLNVDGVKMSKSIGNFYTVHELLQDYDGEVIRLSLLMTHYSAPMNFSLDSIRMAENILNRWYKAIRSFSGHGGEFEDSELFFEDVFEAMLDDMNTPLAISLLSAKAHDIDKVDANLELVAIFVNTCRNLLGLSMRSDKRKILEQRRLTDEQILEIELKVAERKEAKMRKDFAKADEIRDFLLKDGIVLEDTRNETLWRKS
ncbi:MAG: cysteine--tRNA ligase [Holosporales bacterium]|jgi:cysteinyl-tRNA synthetase|nr:cysteine--tRNA ligase [Holosporales bacterium]